MLFAHLDDLGIFGIAVFHEPLQRVRAPLEDFGLFTQEPDEDIFFVGAEDTHGPETSVEEVEGRDWGEMNGQGPRKMRRRG